MFLTSGSLCIVFCAALAMAALVVEVWRDGLVESEHHIHAAVCDADGRVLRAWGDPGRVAFPRSSLKPLQAMALVESGAAEAAGLNDAEVAIACASHGAEPFHLEVVRSVLAKAGIEESALRCGAHRPAYLPAADALVRELAARGRLAAHPDPAGR
ncbi:MAG: asparaginase, partial [Armatimonadota bacterium]|nr:asparaginase [Armatimonadota bacterium]